MKRLSGDVHGAVMVFAVLLLAAGVFVLAGIAQLAATQGLAGQEEWRTLNRRVTLENSRAMARQFMMSRMFSNVVSSPVGLTNDALGGFMLEPVGTSEGGDYWTTRSVSGLDGNLSINPFTLMERGGFYRAVVPGTLLVDSREKATNTAQWNFQVRTRSPICAGFSLVQQRPATNMVQDLAVAGRPYIDMGNLNSFTGFNGMPRMPVSSATATNAEETNGYVGFLSVPLVPGGYSFGVFTNYRYEPTGDPATAARVIVDLGAVDRSDTNNVVLLDLTDNFVAYTNINTGMVSDLPLEVIVLEGAGDPIAPPLHIVAGPSITNLKTLVLSNNNERPVYLNRAKSENDGVSFDVLADPNATSWRLGMTFSRCDVRFNIGSLAVTGGVRTDADIIVEGFEPRFLPEGAPGGLDYIADRMMWLEDYRKQ